MDVDHGSTFDPGHPAIAAAAAAPDSWRGQQEEYPEHLDNTIFPAGQLMLTPIGHAYDRASRFAGDLWDGMF